MWKFFWGLKTASDVAQHIEYLLSLSNEIADLQRAESANIEQILHEMKSILVVIEKNANDGKETRRPGDKYDCLNN